MSSEHPEADLYEILQNEDFPLWFAELQVRSRESAKWIILRFLQHGLAELSRGSTVIPEWKWRAVLDDPSSWTKSDTSDPVLKYIGTEEKEKAFFLGSPD